MTCETYPCLPSATNNLIIGVIQATEPGGDGDGGINDGRQMAIAGPFVINILPAQRASVIFDYEVS